MILGENCSNEWFQLYRRNLRQVDSQFIVTARMLLNGPAWKFIIGISNRNTLIEQSFALIEQSAVL